jgi:hypothetical protein
MSTLAELRAYVRTQTDTLESDLPSATIDNYIREAYNRTMSLETQWPFFEESWSATQAAGNVYLSVPTDCAEIVSLKDVANSNYRLTYIDYEEAEDQYFRSLGGSGSACEYSIWKDIIYLWPQVTFSDDRVYSVRGYREALDWMTGPATVATPDCDERLHLPLCHYAIALAYAQQEAAGLEDVYMERWRRDVDTARNVIMDPRRHRPLTMGPHRITRIGAGRYRPVFTIDTP